MFFFQLLLLCIAVSFDGLGAGFAYGARDLRIPLLSLIIISLSSALLMFLAMLLGRAAAYYFPLHFAGYLGGAILIAMGCWMIFQQKAISQFFRRGSFWKTFKDVLAAPQEADIDRSGTINSKEAFLLGLVLASDAFGAGIGVALAGFNPWLTSFMVGAAKFFLLKVGLSWGHISARVLAIPAHLLAGGILILLGIFNIL